MELLLVLGIILAGGLASEKRWLPDLDWENPDNWLDGLVPGSDTRVVFPVEMRHAVGMPRTYTESLTLAGFELSRDGILALPEDAKLLMNDRDEPGRASSHWLRDAPYYWVDPLNWDSDSEATPHLERLPCQGDVVVLPSSSKTFSMRLPLSRAIEVQEVRLADDNESLARWEWRALSDKHEFIAPDGSHGLGAFTVKYSPLMGCENCRCQEGDLSEYWEEVCEVQRPRCERLGCEYPLRVEGHCCHYCGGRVRLSKKTLVSTAKRVARNILNSWEDDLDWHSRLTWDEEHVEILVAEKGTYEGTNTLIAIAELESKLREANVEVLSTETSGSPLNSNRLWAALAPMTLTLFVPILFFLIMCMTSGYTLAQLWSASGEIAAVLFVDSRTHNGITKNKKKTFAFARFENQSEANVLLAEEENKETDQAKSNDGERFENPLYRSKRKFSKGSTQHEDQLNLNETISLTGLQKAIELDSMDGSVEMDIENF